MLRIFSCILTGSLIETTWMFSGTQMKVILDDLKSHNLTLTEAVNTTQNQPFWRLLAVDGSMIM